MTISMNADLENIDKKVSLPIEWPYRLIGNLFLLSIIFLACLGIITIKHSLVSKTMFDIKQSFYDWSSKIGFTIDDIIIENREKTTLYEIEEALGIGREDNILNIDLKSLKEKLEEIPWIKQASLKRSFFPNIIHIHIKEKDVAAVWQNKHIFFPVTSEGDVINVENYVPDSQVLLIIGEKAPDNFKDLVEIISQDENIFKRIKVATFISSRRWDIILDDINYGITIKLPEKNIEKSWKKLIKINNSDGILKRKLTNIDLRLNNKIIVKIDQSE